jgi:O-glycosyl hydrolase
MNKKNLLAVTGIILTVAFFAAGCKMAVNDPVREIPIVNPYISVHPQSASYNVQHPDYVGYDALEVYVHDWIGMDGTLSYQWYRFENMEAYNAGNVTEISGNSAKRARYFPSLEETAGKTYYFFVVVTNDYPDALAGTPSTDTITSDIAIISFYNNSMAPRPVITRYPSSASYIIGRAESINPLEVRAVADGIAPPGTTDIKGRGNVTYQWYRSATKSSTGGTPIASGDTASFMPDFYTLAKDHNYYYVVVTNTVTIGGASVTATATTPPVDIFMAIGEKAAPPRITLQPQDQMIFGSGTATPLTVAASPTDGGTISYQWYRADKPADTAEPVWDSQGNRVLRHEVTPVEETIISGATSASFPPDLTIAPGQEAYYFVKVKNTNTSVTDPTKTENELSSNIVTVKVAASGTQDANAWITIPPGYNVPGHAVRQQYIRGYGGMDVPWANFYNTSEAETELMHNPDWGLGYNILRIMIVPPGSTQRNFTNHEDIIIGRKRPADADQNWTNEGWNGLIESGQRPDYIKNVQMVNKYNGYVLASPWTPPKEWKSNNDINSGGHLMPANYQSFANYLRSFAQFMYYQDAPIYAISIANEPNYAGGYDGCEWLEQECVDFFLKVGQFTQGVRGFGGGKSMPRVLIVNGESANTPEYNKDVLANPTSRAAVDFYARHVYGSQLETLWDKCSFADWKQGSPYQTECWMTEHNINSANSIAFPDDSTWTLMWRFMNDVDLVIRRNNENAFVWWASKRFYSFIGEGQYGATEGTVLPRGYGLSHYAKYSNDTWRFDVSVGGQIYDGDISVGALIGVTSSNVNALPTSFSLDAPDVKITAFVSPDGNEISLVMFTPTRVPKAITSANKRGEGGFALGTVRIDMPTGFEIGSVQAVKSWGDTRKTGDGPGELGELMVPYEVTVAPGRNAAYVTVDRSEILSVKFTNKR